jgi:hypothetical protein
MPILDITLSRSLVDRLDVVLHDLGFAELLRQFVLDRDQRLESEPGVDRFRTVAGETGEVMHFARLARLDDEADGRAQTLADQMMMHARGREQRGDRNAVRAGRAVGQDDDVDIVLHGLFGGGAQGFERAGDAFRAFFGGIGRVERARIEGRAVEAGDRADLLKIVVRENRLAHFEALALRRALVIENVRPRPDEGHEAHHDLFADRVDRRVRDLGEVLLEIGVEQLRLVGEGGNGRVVAHGARGFLADRRHRRHQELQIFLRVAEGLLAIEERQVRAPGLGRYRRQFFQHKLRVGEPFLIGMQLRELRLDLLVGDDAALDHVDEQHLAGLQPPLLHDLFFRNREDAGFGRHDDAVVVGDETSARGAGRCGRAWRRSGGRR